MAVTPAGAVYLLSKAPHHLIHLKASINQPVQAQSLFFGRSIEQLRDCILDLLVLLASVASWSFGTQYPVLRVTLEFTIYGESLRLRHVDVALGRVGVKVNNVELKGRHCGADCRSRSKMLGFGGVGGGERRDGGHEDGGGNLHRGEWRLELEVVGFVVQGDSCRLI